MLAGLAFPMSLMGTALPFDVFKDIKTAFSNAMSTTTDVGGFVAGLAIVVVLGLAATLLVGRDSPFIALILTVAVIAFVALIGFWPWWTLIFLVIFAAWGIASKMEFFSSKA